MKTRKPVNKNLSMGTPFREMRPVTVNSVRGISEYKAEFIVKTCYAKVYNTTLRLVNKVNDDWEMYDDKIHHAKLKSNLKNIGKIKPVLTVLCKICTTEDLSATEFKKDVKDLVSKVHPSGKLNELEDKEGLVQGIDVIDTIPQYRLKGFHLFKYVKGLYDFLDTYEKYFTMLLVYKETKSSCERRRNNILHGLTNDLRENWSILDSREIKLKDLDFDRE